MGQQQLLLLVLSVIIVGVAVVGGVQIADKSFRQHDADLLIDRALMIAQSAVFWKAKTDPFEGGNASYTGLEDGGFEILFTGEKTDIGVYKITKADGLDLELTAVSNRYPEVGIVVTVFGEEIVGTEVAYDGSITLEDADD